MTDITAGTAERSRWEAFVYALHFLLAVLRARPLFALGYVIVLLVFVLAIFAPFIAPYEPEVANPVDFLQGPSWRHLFAPMRPAWISSAASSTRPASTSPSRSRAR